MFKKAEQGFTVLELLVAVTILTVGLLGLASMLASGVGGNRFSHMVAVEGSIATSVMEEIVSRDATDAIFSANVTGAAYDLDPGTAATTRVVQGRTYSATYSILSASPVAGVVRVDVSVTSGGRTASLTSFKSVV